MADATVQCRPAAGCRPIRRVGTHHPARQGCGGGWLTLARGYLIIARMSRVQTPSAVGLLAGAVLVASCSAPASLGWGPTPTSPPTPTPTPVPSPTPTPTPVPAMRLESAEMALFYGDWETALAQYQAAMAAAADLEDQAAAGLGYGMALVRAGRVWEGYEALTRYLDGYPTHADRARGWFYRAEAARLMGQAEQALQDYGRYLQDRPGQIDAYVQEIAGDLLRGLGRPLEAIPRYQAAWSSPRLGSGHGVLLKIGQAYMEAGDWSAAIGQFDRVYQTATDAATRASANLLAGQTLVLAGDTQAGYARYLDSVALFPEAYDTYIGLIRLVDAGVAVDDFQRGLVDYNAGAHAPALAAFDRFLAVTPTGTGYYYRGLTRRALGDALGAVADFETAIGGFPDDPHWVDAWLAKGFTEWAYLDRYAVAVQTYLGFAAAAPGSPAADDALFAAARTSERSGDLASAAMIWLRIPNEMPGSEFAWQGAFEAGIAQYRAMDYEGARMAFALAEGIAAAPGDRAAARLWIGKTRLAQGDAVGTVTDWQAAAAADPTGYYSVRAEDLLAGRQPFDSQGTFDLNVDLEARRLEAETWLRATFPIVGPEPLDDLGPVLASEPRVMRGLEYWNLGLYENARAEFESLRQAYENDAEATYRLMHACLDLGLYRSGIFAARQVLRLAGMDDAGTMTAPVFFNLVRFGLYFGDLILPQALAYEFDGLFLLSVVRQESLFEGFATSSASARGLMQVIPSTGQSIADQLGWPPDYTTPDLHRPVVSVRFGSYYLAQQRDRFAGDLYASLAGYNAGPGNAEIWKALAPDDPDLFLEVIRLQEPHLYIRRIYEIFAIYRRLYVGN
jgi:soluble lytic murein transglycosylase